MIQITTLLRPADLQITVERLWKIPAPPILALARTTGKWSVHCGTGRDGYVPLNAARATSDPSLEHTSMNGIPCRDTDALRSQSISGTC